MEQTQKFIDPRHARAELVGEAQEAYEDFLDDVEEGPFSDSDGRSEDEALKIDERTGESDNSTSGGEQQNGSGNNPGSKGAGTGTGEQSTTTEKGAATGEQTTSGKIIQHQADQGDKTSQTGSTTQQSVEEKGTSLFDKSLSQNGNTEGAGTNAGGNAGSEGTKQPVRLSDDDLVEFNGEIVPFHTIKGSTMLKKDYDKKLAKLEEEKAKVQKDKIAIDVASPYVDALIKDPFGRSYMEGLVGTGDPDKALAMAAIAAGKTVVKPEAQQEQVDPRLVPPTDTAGQQLDEDDPRYLKWLAESAPIRAELAAEKRWNELEAKRNQEAEAQRAEADREAREAEAKLRENEEFTTEVVKKNTAVLSTLPKVLLDRGLDVSKLSKAEYSAVKRGFAEACEGYGKHVLSDAWLKENLLENGDIALVVDAAGLVGKYGKGNQGVGAQNGNANGSSNLAPERVAEVEPGQQTNNGVQEEGKLNPKEGRLRQMHNQRRPLNAGGPSQAIAGVDEGRKVRQGPDDGWQGAHDEMRGSSRND